MRQFHQKQPRLNLSLKEYGFLRERVLQSDRWRCQECGSSKQLEVHHLIKRSKLEDDKFDNLISFCNTYRHQYHRGFGPIKALRSTSGGCSNHVSGTSVEGRNHSFELSVSGETPHRLCYVSYSLLGVNWIAPQERTFAGNRHVVPVRRWMRCKPGERKSRLLVSQVSFGEAVNRDLSRKGIKHEDDYSGRC